MLFKHKDKVTSMVLTTTPGGSLGIAITFENLVSPFARTDVSHVWLASLVDVLGGGVLRFGRDVDYNCRIMVDSNGDLASLGHVTENLWFDVRPSAATHVMESAMPTPASPAERALRFLNRQRAKVGRKPLVPRQVGYTDDDVIADALLYSWRG